MPKDNTGKIIEAIQVKKKTIVLTFFGDETLTISPQIYTDHYFYIGKVIDTTLLEKLKEAQALQPLKDYAFLLLSKGKYSEWQVREKLYRRQAKKYQVETVIQALKDAHLLDDATLFHQWVSHYHQRGYGPRWIEQKMYEKGFSKVLVSSLPSLTEAVPEILKTILTKLIKQYQHLSHREREEKIKLTLQRRGFAFSTISMMMSSQLAEEPEAELTNLRRAFHQIYHRYQKRYQGRLLLDKVINFLRLKGYTYGNIQRVIKETTYVN